MSSPQSARRDATHIDDVVGVEVTIDGMLVIADRLELVGVSDGAGHPAQHSRSRNCATSCGNR